MLNFLAQHFDLLLKICNIVFVRISRALGGFSVFLFLNSGLFVLRKLMGGVVFLERVREVGFMLVYEFRLLEAVLVRFLVRSEFSNRLGLCLSSHVINLIRRLGSIINDNCHVSSP